MTIKGVEINGFVSVRCPGADFLLENEGSTMANPLELACGSSIIDRVGTAVFSGFVCTEVKDGMCKVSKTAKRCTFAI